MHEFRFPGMDEINSAAERAFSPIRQGRLYDVSQAMVGSQTFVIKRLNPKGVHDLYGPTSTPRGIFSLHQKEHEVWQTFMGEFIVPTLFLEDNQEFRIVQPYEADGVQFKEVLDSNRFVPHAQLPELLERTRFIEGLANLTKYSLNHSHQLPDIDFLLTDPFGVARFRIFDTNYFWYPRDEKGLIRPRYLLGKLKDTLFNEAETDFDPVHKALENLDNCLRFLC